MKLLQLYNFLTRSTCRIILERRIKRVRRIFEGRSVLDVGGNKSAHKDCMLRCKRYVTLNKRAAAEPDVIADGTDMPFEDKTFDAALCTEVLEHVRDYQKLVSEIRRVLKDGGICVLSTRFLFKIHDKPEDYFRFTEESLKFIFRDFRDIEIKPMGNAFTVFWDLLFGLSFPPVLMNIASPLIRAIFFWDDRNAPSGYFVTAKK